MNNGLSETFLSLKIPFFNMTSLRYVIREIKINKKFARKQIVTWEEKKKLIFDIINDLSKNIHFLTTDKGKPTYNLVENCDDSETSLSILPLKEGSKDLFENKLLDKYEKNITNNTLNDTNYKNNPFICLFRMGLIKHKDIRLFEEGHRKNLWKFVKGKNSGSLYETTFGIVISDKLKRIFIIKQSWEDTLGYIAFIYYISQKSRAYTINDDSNTFKLLAIPTNESFDAEDVASVESLKVGINGDLIDEYEAKAGKSDAFYILISEAISKFLGKGRTLRFEIEFSEEGDKDAKEIFSDIYSSFSSIQGEEIERLFTNFKASGEKISGGRFDINFKRDQIYTYEPSDMNDSFDKILEAFKWISENLNTRKDEK